MRSTAIVDTGVLLAAADESEEHHRLCLKVLARPDLIPIVPTMVAAEAAFMINLRLGPQAEMRFVRAIAGWDVEAPTADDFIRCAELLEEYSDQNLGVVDASVVALAERMQVGLLLTLDHRHFSVVHPRHVEAFELLPTASG